jgi:hypothetical protein
MIFIGGLLVGCVLSAFALGLLCILLVLHRPATAPTFHHRRANRDKPVPEVQPPWERNLFSELKEGMQDLERRREEGIDYKWLGVTGSEQE